MNITLVEGYLRLTVMVVIWDAEKPCCFDGHWIWGIGRIVDRLATARYYHSVRFGSYLNSIWQTLTIQPCHADHFVLARRMSQAVSPLHHQFQWHWGNVSLVVTASADCTAKIWNWLDGECVQTLSGHRIDSWVNDLTNALTVLAHWEPCLFVCVFFE